MPFVWFAVKASRSTAQRIWYLSVPLPAGDVYSELFISGHFVLSGLSGGREVIGVDVVIGAVDTDRAVDTDNDITGEAVDVGDMPVVLLSCC